MDEKDEVSDDYFFKFIRERNPALTILSEVPMSMYESWDKKLEERNADYTSLQKEMLAVEGSLTHFEPELCFRLAAATFGITFNLDWTRERQGAIKAKTIEAKQYVEKALKYCPTCSANFAVDLWMAKCLGQLILLELDGGNKMAALSMVNQLTHHLSNCVEMEPDNWRVLLLEAQVQVALQENKKELDKLRDQEGSLPSIFPPLMSMATVEAKCRRVLEQNSQSHEAYLALMIAQYMQSKYSEAIETGNEALRLQPLNKGEQFVASTIESFIPDVEKKQASSSNKTKDSDA